MKSMFFFSQWPPRAGGEGGEKAPPHASRAIQSKPSVLHWQAWNFVLQCNTKFRLLGGYPP